MRLAPIVPFESGTCDLAADVWYKRKNHWRRRGALDLTSASYDMDLLYVLYRQEDVTGIGILFSSLTFSCLIMPIDLSTNMLAVLEDFKKLWYLATSLYFCCICYLESPIREVETTFSR